MGWWLKIRNFFRDRIWANFILYLSLVIIIFIFGIFIGIFIKSKDLLQKQIELRAKSLLSCISISRRWNADYHGVWVEKKPGVKSDPFLTDPDLLTQDSRVLTRRTPFKMLQEIAELAEEYGWFSLRVVSPEPLNPANKPDAFESQALKTFREKEVEEFFGMEQVGDRTFFRALKALWVEEGCLSCHRLQNYSLGEIRGALSLKFEVTDFTQAIEKNKKLLILSSLAALVALLGIIYYLVVKLMQKIAAAQRQLIELATIDELTGLFNRRYFYERFDQEVERAKRYQHPLSCLILDLDDFKQVNDTYGHLAGDRVLREVAAILKANCRASDLAARYGGEEMILLLPETEVNGARVIAERLRALIAAQVIPANNGHVIHITASIGVASVNPAAWADLPHSEKLIQAADDALYQAKARGKNSVVVAPIADPPGNYSQD